MHMPDRRAARPAAVGGHRLPSLLLADDDADLREPPAIQLARRFEIVAVAVNAGEAVALGTRHQPDVAS
jgi:CheY-like chemotaxis protein